MKTKLLLAVTLLLSMTVSGHAAMIIVGHHEILPDAISFVEIQIEREAGDPDVFGGVLALQIGDGVTGPMIKSVSLTAGTIFDGHALSSTNPTPDSRQVFPDVELMAPMSLPDSGVLAIVEIDATGITSGTFDLVANEVTVSINQFSSTQVTEFFDSNVNSVPLTVQNGTVSIAVPIPEPSSALLLLSGLCFAYRRR